MTKPPLVVTSHARDLVAPGIATVLADVWLAPGRAEAPPDLVVNLCRSHRYLSRGWYVSLLAEARGVAVVPPPWAMGEQPAHELARSMRQAGVEVIDPADAAERRKRSGIAGTSDDPPPVRSWSASNEPVFRRPAPEEVATALFAMGKSADPRFRAVASRVFGAWPMPLMRATFVREDDRWKLVRLRSEPVHKLDAEGLDLLRRALLGADPGPSSAGPHAAQLPSLAVLYDEADPFRASSSETIDRLVRVCGRMGLRVERIGLNEPHRLGEHDALFIRCLAGVDQPSFRFARRARGLGMPVIDDPDSLVRCGNKIYLHELFEREGIAAPKTMVATPSTPWAELAAALGAPVVLKVPDGSFSSAVFKAADAAEYEAKVRPSFRQTPLLLAQEFVASEFDWRVGVLDGRPLFAARYFMAPGHWQIRSAGPLGARYGRVQAVSLAQAPADVLDLAVRACRPIGDGLYGVDLKELGDGRVVVIEVNDNPNLDVGYEDGVEGDVVYERIARWFLDRIARSPGRAPSVAAPPQPVDALAAMRQPIGLPVKPPRRDWRAYEVCGIELEYTLTNRDLNARPLAPDLLQALGGRPTSDVELGRVAFSNEMFEHVIELKTPLPLKSFAETEQVLVEGVRRAAMVLAARHRGRVLPGGMHPWLDPKEAQVWRRSNRPIYETYERVFDVQTHGWANVLACHVNLPAGSDQEIALMMNAAGMLLPYLPAIAASSPMHDGELQPSADARLAWILEHQARLPESLGDLVPEPFTTLAGYRRDVIKPMYDAVDRIPGSRRIRAEWLNARGAVLKMSRKSMEVRLLDVQDCVKMDVAIACFVRSALRELGRELAAGRLTRPPQAVLAADLRAAIRDGSRATVQAPHLREAGQRPAPIRDALHRLLRLARRNASEEAEGYLELVGQVIEQGSLSERIAARLQPKLQDADAFTEEARRIWIELADCLLENRPWAGRALLT